MSEETKERLLTIEHGDSLEVLREMPDESVDSIVTDPPAGIDFMGKGWDSDKGGRDKWIAWLREIMVEGLRVLKPGGHALVWAIPRTSHWTATAVEDAGFEIRDVVNHLFGTGFPKSLDVSKAIDAKGGNAHMTKEIGAALKKAREARGVSITQADKTFCDGTTLYSWFEGRPAGQQIPTVEPFAKIVAAWPELASYADAVAEVERDVLGKKDGTKLAVAPGQDNDRSSVALAVTAPATEAAKQWEGWGTALKPAAEHWILARKPLCGTVAANVLKHGTGALNVDACRIGEREGAEGRWPANVVLDEEAAEALDEQSGFSRSPGKVTRGGSRREAYGMGRQENVSCPADSGGASRFFYVAKPSTAERDEGLEAFAAKSGGEATGRKDGTDGLKSPRAGAGRTGNRKNVHPTVKSVALMRWLCRLITPPGGLVLDPFAGSGSTGCACAVEGFDFVGIEREAEYVEIARARLARWLEKAEKGEA